jgi:hypothetical protein
MFKHLRWPLARPLMGSESQEVGNAPFLRTPEYMSEVEENLERSYGLKIERRNQHIPELRLDQFDRDLGAMHRGRLHNPRRPENNNRALQ